MQPQLLNYDLSSFSFSGFNWFEVPYDSRFSKLFTSSLAVSPTSVDNKLVQFDILDFLSHIGGIAQVLIYLFGLFLFPFAEQSFFIASLNSLYKARTIATNLFIHCDPPETNISSGKPKRNVQFEFDSIDKNFKDEQQNKSKIEMNKRKTIAVSSSDIMYLYWRKLFGCSFDQSNGKYEKKNNRLKKLQVLGK